VNASSSFDVKTQLGLQFAVHDGEELLADFYAPVTTAAVPVVIAAHSGAWKSGARDYYQYWGPWLASRGYALLSIDYRLVAGERNRYPAAVQDMRAALQFVRDFATSLGIDPARVALMGDSAGAYLASLVALAGDLEPFRGGTPASPQGGISTRVKAVVGAYGIYDLLAQWEHDLHDRPRDQFTEAFLGISATENKRLYQEASPYSYATAHANNTGFLLVWGPADDMVDWRSQSQRFLVALRQAGYLVRAAVVPGAGHFFMREPIDEPHSFSAFVAPRLLRFLNEFL
jgi:acetyl esterase/lipase